MLRPVNKHILIEPILRDDFIPQDNERYQEIGVVVSFSYDIPEGSVKVGDRVFFDAWLASRYPISSKLNDYYWLVEWQHIRMIENA